MWPHPLTPPGQRLSRSSFRASYGSTLALLERELWHLGARSVLFGIGLTERDIRLDRQPRADARPASHPGVEISFTDRDGRRLVYATDSCELWQHNVRSVALGLEALRAVDRYGITRSGEQYAGFRPITADGPGVEVELDRDRWLIGDQGSFQAALRATHPDIGGDRADIEAVLAARQADRIRR